MPYFRQMTRLRLSFRCLPQSRHFTGSLDKLPPATPGCHANPQVFKFVDKTHLLAKIMNYTATPTFLHAPAMRRIGKTTTVNLLEAMARGEREMFEGMAVNADDSAFRIGEAKFSVIRLDFSGLQISNTDPFHFKSTIVKELIYRAELQHGLDLRASIDKDVEKKEDKYKPGDTIKLWLDSLRLK